MTLFKCSANAMQSKLHVCTRGQTKRSNTFLDETIQFGRSFKTARCSGCHYCKMQLLLFMRGLSVIGRAIFFAPSRTELTVAGHAVASDYALL